MVPTIDDLSDALVHHAAFRRRRSLQPIGGAGTKLFPPTYPGSDEAGRQVPPRHVFERRHLGGAEVWCVLLDSVQSQANRLEEALLDAAEDGLIELPRLVVDFPSAGLDTVGPISSLDAPHRIFDAILRDSLLGGVPFQDSGPGRAVRAATIRNAGAILEASPSALLFGAWNSTGQGGGMGAKFTRAIVSEIIGVDVPMERHSGTGGGDARASGGRTGSRIDPLGISGAPELYKGGSGWDVTEKGAGKGAKKVRPSEINHGNIRPSVMPLGVTCAYAEQTATITLAGLRRLRFGTDPARNAAARTLIAALGLVAMVELDARGHALRSRCDLVPDGEAPLELVRADGSLETVALDRETARALYAQAVAGVRAAGFDFRSEPVVLVPQPRLVALVRHSLERASTELGEETVDADS